MGGGGRVRYKGDKWRWKKNIVICVYFVLFRIYSTHNHLGRVVEVNENACLSY